MAGVIVSQMDVKLPIDLLHLVCTELASRSDFGTLYSCAVSSKHFADAGALANLYRISHLAPVKSGNETLPPSEQELLIQKWSIMWRTIILSCYGSAMYPYVRYLRVLDLRDLYYLLDEDRFRGKIHENFFGGPLAQFDYLAQAPGTRQQKMRAKGQGIRTNVVAMGDVIVKNAPMLEELTEPIVGEYNILSGALPRWAPELGRLQSLELWDGKTLGNEAVRTMLHAHCPQLRRIRVYQWCDHVYQRIEIEDANNSPRREDDSDHKLAQFISNMPANTLIDFENHAECGIGPETCLAFNRHSQSLTALALAVPEKGVRGLGLLQSCTNIERLKLTDLQAPRDMKETMEDVLQDMVDWLKLCKGLREISLTHFVSAPEILTEVLNVPDIKLEDLQVNARDGTTYKMKDHGNFHRAIGQQRKLRSLLLTADAEPFSPAARDSLVSRLVELKELRYLQLTKVSDYFQDGHVQQLSKSLVKLEELTLAGWQLGDSSLAELHRLTELKSLTFNGASVFTAGGLLDYINELGPNNQGLSLSIDMAETASALSNEEQDLVRDALMDKVGGRFEYQMIRDPDQEEFYGSDSD